MATCPKENPTFSRATLEKLMFVMAEEPMNMQDRINTSLSMKIVKKIEVAHEDFRILERGYPKYYFNPVLS